jgi:hypothetical protein
MVWLVRRGGAVMSWQEAGREVESQQVNSYQDIIPANIVQLGNKSSVANPNVFLCLLHLYIMPPLNSESGFRSLT